MLNPPVTCEPDHQGHCINQAKLPQVSTSLGIKVCGRGSGFRVIGLRLSVKVQEFGVSGLKHGQAVSGSGCGAYRGFRSRVLKEAAQHRFASGARGPTFRV